MKVLFVGLGSIGKRHLKNMSILMSDMEISFEAFALRSTTSTLDNDTMQHIRGIYTKLEQVPNDFDIAFITNPTSLHYTTIEHIREKAIHLFIEKPIFESVDYDIEKIKPRDSKAQYYVACPIRHTTLFQELQKICRQTPIYSIRAICSSYLPDWRPGVDYRKTYSAHSQLGGGVDLDLIHELDYLTALFAFPMNLYKLRGTYSALDLESCDIACYIGEYADKMLELHLDYFGVIPKRELELYTDSDVIIADFVKQEIRWQKNSKILCFQEQRDSWCQKELQYFIRLCQGLEQENINDIFHAFHVLKLAMNEGVIK